MEFVRNSLRLTYLTALVCIFILAACAEEASPTSTIPAQTATTVPRSIAPVTPTASPATAIASPSPVDTPLPFSADLVRDSASGLQLQRGFTAEVLPESFNGMSVMVFGPDDKLYIAQASGTITRLDYSKGDGTTRTEAVASDLSGLLGITFVGNDLYVSSRGRVTKIPNATGTPGEHKQIVSDLPSGAHQNDTIAQGPDGLLYLSVGSTCNACRESDPLSATVIRFRLDGSNLEVFARGLRNNFGIAFHPVDGTLWGVDNGRDDLGSDAPPEELNLLVKDGHYGWPDCWGTNRGSNCQGTLPPVVELEPRSSANGLMFYTGAQFPQEYKNDAFVTEYGAHARTSGMKVVRVKLNKTATGYTGSSIDFATGFDRPLAIAQDPSGALLIGDYGTGKIYKIRYLG